MHAPCSSSFASIASSKTIDSVDGQWLALYPHWQYPHWESIAKGSDHAASDVDFLVIGNNVSHASLLDALAPAGEQLGRIINPTLYTQEDVAQRVRDGKSFILRVLEQPKMFVLGSNDDVSRLSGAGQPGAH